jgi:hypothetical protein
MKRVWVALMIALLPAPALAASCRTITFFEDAEKIKAVGEWSNCPGQKGLTGTRTRFREIEIVELRSPPPPPGSRPCEFRASGCSAISSPR